MYMFFLELIVKKLLNFAVEVATATSSRAVRVGRLAQRHLHTQ